MNMENVNPTTSDASNMTKFNKFLAPSATESNMHNLTNTTMAFNQQDPNSTLMLSQ
jgi:hypothetical protein